MGCAPCLVARFPFGALSCLKLIIGNYGYNTPEVLR
jgi:hypothetical protein